MTSEASLLCFADFIAAHSRTQHYVAADRVLSVTTAPVVTFSAVQEAETEPLAAYSTPESPLRKVCVCSREGKLTQKKLSFIE